MLKNNLQNKIYFAGALLIAGLLFTRTEPTYAFLNDGEAIKDNTFAAGALTIDLTDVTTGDPETTVSPSSSITKFFNVENVGNEVFKYSLETTNPTGDADLCSELLLKAYWLVDGEEPQLKYEGKLGEFLLNGDGADTEMVLAMSGDTHKYMFEYYLGEDADAALSLLSCNFDILAKAWMPEFSYQTAHWDNSQVSDGLASENWLVNMGYETAETLADEEDEDPELGFCEVLTHDKSAEDGTAATQEIKWDKVEGAERYVLNKYLETDPDVWTFIDSTVVLLTNPNLTENEGVMTFVTSEDTEGVFAHYIQAFDASDELIGATTPKNSDFTCTFEVEWFDERDVVINEIMWGGSSVHERDEWIELRNTTDEDIDLTDWIIDGAGPAEHEIKLTGAIPANGYYLVSYYPTDYDSGSEKAGVNDDIEEDEYRRTGPESMHLDDNGEKLVLKDPADNTIDETPDVPNGPDGGWAAGQAGNNGDDSSSWRSMQRIETEDDEEVGDGDNEDNWYTCNHDECDDDTYWDEGDGQDYGTPKNPNLADEEQIEFIELTMPLSTAGNAPTAVLGDIESETTNGAVETPLEETSDVVPPIIEGPPPSGVIEEPDDGIVDDGNTPNDEPSGTEGSAPEEITTLADVMEPEGGTTE
ncbi:hypothetical protein A2619_05680 [candidate division WWE3 bacterium RIFOXYD1_FULL_39_9]|uniref:LTD domain-containing protein n=1 Tax=candidate division WWE3 bacterium RIFOXYD1_FULL_39_9 TaxID=1802649 RepID=A0A1F4X9D2_UNCKA|nr:MAG: hypothetical protein A2619_05680 [candidate division WWE3 bacterium RIFOXYD1_FULL_39_9]